MSYEILKYEKDDTAALEHVIQQIRNCVMHHGMILLGDVEKDYFCLIGPDNELTNRAAVVMCEALNSSGL